MPSSRLGVGASGTPLAPTDCTVAGVATRDLAASDVGPANADWGVTPPPDGTIVTQAGGLFWFKTGGLWYVLVGS